MFRLNLPIMDNLDSLGGDAKLTEYHLYSSIFETTPKLFFVINSKSAMPDAMNLFLGSSFPMNYVIADENGLTPEEKAAMPKEDTRSEEDIMNGVPEEEDETSGAANSNEPELVGGDLPGMFVAKIEVESSGGGVTTKVNCEHDFLAFQTSTARKAYVSKYGKEIVEDITSSNQVLKVYEKCIDETDNAATIYRTLGDSDMDLISGEICDAFSVAGGRPQFFIGLNNKVYFTSINKLIAKDEKSRILVTTNCADNDATIKTKEEIIKNYVDSDTVSELKAADFKLTLGDKDSIFNIKTAVYYTNFVAGMTNTNGYIFKPANEKKMYYPVDKIFMSMSDAKNSVAVTNRPSANICYESANLFDIFENLITVKVRINNCNTLKKLIVAGEHVTFVSPYLYSVYNGNYLVAEVEYGMKDSITFIELVLIRPTLDFAWSEKMIDDKDSENFPYQIAATINKNGLYSI